MLNNNILIPSYKVFRFNSEFILRPTIMERQPVVLLWTRDSNVYCGVYCGTYSVSCCLSLGTHYALWPAPIPIFFSPYINRKNPIQYRSVCSTPEFPPSRIFQRLISFSSGVRVGYLPSLSIGFLEHSREVVDKTSTR